MTKPAKRYHPAYIAVELFAALKGLSGFYLLLFLLKANSTAGWVIWGRYALLTATLASILFILSKWMFNRYELGTQSIIFKEGMLVKKQKTVAWDRIHSHRTSTTFIHRWFGLTSLTLETGMSGENAEFEFPVITQAEKDRVVARLEENQEEMEAGELTKPQRTIHFRATKKDLMKASFTSLSFLAIFPLLSAIYFNLTDFFAIEESAESVWSYLLDHVWILITLFLIAMILSILIGFIKTTIKYGNYVISDDEERIYIEKGIGNEVSFSIPKNKVQAVKVEQSIVKKALGLVSIKLISAGTSEGKEEEISSLYPFMPKHEAYDMLHTILPHYQIKEEMERFPVKVLWLKLIQPYYLTIAALIGLWIFKKEWLWIAAIVFGLSILLRTLDYWFTSYTRHGHTVQIRKGGWLNETFVTHLHRIQQVTVKHSWLERKFGVATIMFSNRADPAHESLLFGVDNEEAGRFYEWYHRKSVSG
ncbi:PH domain-containing protein [Bacillus haikouensis]|jgi:putative membrane protein|uniref:PH domain-containing protein n=1 Tax=Bacillus haikouensis TaxID=1510468 RepID=UPI0015526DB1|nr:PH domain-containing protein [Bacillus haikouensis]NQD68258.1 PH domain-containing protein [Bacillus haikouensis]